jgi:outer membrane protein OmpA-like peptidoglycan-associated protein
MDPKQNRSLLRSLRPLAALALPLAVLATACGDNALPNVAVPKSEGQRPLPTWYPEAPWSAREGKSQVLIEGKVVFDTNKATIRPGSEKVLKTLLQFLDQHPEVTRLRIEGHTDARASEDLNMELSAKRSLAVCDWLVDNGVDHTRLIAVGFGESRPLGPNNQEAGRSDNRRTEFHVAEVNGRPFAGKDPYNGGFALEVLSVAERKKKKEQEEAARRLVFKVPPPFKPTGDLVKQVDQSSAAATKKPRQDGASGGQVLQPEKVQSEKKDEQGGDAKKQNLGL